MDYVRPRRKTFCYYFYNNTCYKSGGLKPDFVYYTSTLSSDGENYFDKEKSGGIGNKKIN